MLKCCRAESEETADAVETRLSHSLKHRLVLWINHCERRGMRLTGMLIRSKAELLRDTMLADGVPSPLDEKCASSFSNGWLYSFQLRSKLIFSNRLDGGVNDAEGHSGVDDESNDDDISENEDDNDDDEERAIEAFDQENSSGRKWIQPMKRKHVPYSDDDCDVECGVLASLHE